MTADPTRQEQAAALNRGLAQLRAATELALGYAPVSVSRAEATAILDALAVATKALEQAHELLDSVRADEPFIRGQAIGIIECALAELAGENE